MTFQQLEYIVAVDTFRHFVNAATQCGVSQSTLSATIAKLEQEIDVVIFDRSKHPIEPTSMGKRVIEQARLILHNSAELRDLTNSDREGDHSQILLGFPASLAPFICTQYVRHIHDSHPSIESHLCEQNPAALRDALLRSQIDMVMLPHEDVVDTNLREIQLIQERFVVYVSPAHPLHERPNLRPEDLKDGDFWVQTDFHDHYPQFSDVTHQMTAHHTFLENGSLFSLVNMVDHYGGFTILPELFTLYLSSEQQKNVRKVNSGKYFRIISLVTRQNFMRERLIQIVANAIRQMTPAEMRIKQS